jgi:Ni/Co efflux regulator RcnB
MKRILIGAMALTMAAGSTALAQPMGGGMDRGHDDRAHQGDNNNHGQNQQPPRRRGWGQDYGNGHSYRRGQRMGYNDWHSAQRVPDYRARHLRAPPRGYEWRRTNDGQYILAAVATGVILSIILGNR